MRVCWMVGLLAAGLHAQPLRCTVDVYVTASVLMPAGMLSGASERMAAMFGEVGLNIRMITNPRVLDADTCHAPIHLQIENATQYQGAASALAYSTPYGNSGTAIHVFQDRVFLGKTRRQAVSVLAHVMAHEITHVLQGIDRHSDEGVMKACWSVEDYPKMYSGQLRFAEQDVQLLHLAVVNTYRARISGR